MDRFRGAVRFAMSISLSMGLSWIDRHFLETCRLQGKGVVAGLSEL